MISDTWHWIQFDTELFVDWWLSIDSIRYDSIDKRDKIRALDLITLKILSLFFFHLLFHVESLQVIDHRVSNDGQRYQWNGTKNGKMLNFLRQLILRATFELNEINNTEIK